MTMTWTKPALLALALIGAVASAAAADPNPAILSQLPGPESAAVATAEYRSTLLLERARLAREAEELAVQHGPLHRDRLVNAEAIAFIDARLAAAPEASLPALPDHAGARLALMEAELAELSGLYGPIHPQIRWRIAEANAIATQAVAP